MTPAIILPSVRLEVDGEELPTRAREHRLAYRIPIPTGGFVLKMEFAASRSGMKFVLFVSFFFYQAGL